MLRVEGLRKSFDGFAAVDGVSLAVGAGRSPPSSARTAPASRRCSTCITGHLRPDARPRGARGARHHRRGPASPSAGWAWAARSSAPTSSASSPCSRTCRPRSSRTAARHAISGAAVARPLSRRDRRPCWARSASLGQAATRQRHALARQPEAARARHRAGQRSARSCCSTSRPPACRPAETRETIRLLERIVPSASSPCSSPSTTWMSCSRSPRRSPSCTRAG